MHHNPDPTERDRRLSLTDIGCTCCGELVNDYARRHPHDPNARQPFRYTGSGRHYCPFCFSVCRQTGGGRDVPVAVSSEGGDATED
jgi:hypothetical protein